MIIGMLGGLGFPFPAFWGWLLLLVEIVFGIAVLIGWKLEWTAWPLAAVLAVATVIVYLPMIGEAMGFVNVMFHLIAIAGLISLALGGAGKWSVE